MAAKGFAVVIFCGSVIAWQRFLQGVPPRSMARSAAGGSLLDWFYRLVDTNASTRHSAAVAIAEHLESAQRAHEEHSGGTSQCPDLEYALKRLIRGLASPRDCARQGFGAALSTVLATFRKQVAVGDVDL